MSDKKINLVMADKCYNLCIKSYQEKMSQNLSRRNAWFKN
ncbi:hypothetical protein pb186bvf_018691 [Paramecium bursaria]